VFLEKIQSIAKKIPKEQKSVYEKRTETTFKKICLYMFTYCRFHSAFPLRPGENMDSDSNNNPWEAWPIINARLNRFAVIADWPPFNNIVSPVMTRQS